MRATLSQLGNLKVTLSIHRAAVCEYDGFAV
jgi:hypothetical protein